jgi:hypothetical protein
MFNFLITFFHYIIGDLQNYFYKGKIMKLSNGDYFLKREIPSFTQWESKDKVDDIVKGKFDAKNDKLWRKSGTKTKEEYEMYSWQICGMTCLKMILKSINNEKDYKLVELAKDALKY